MASPFTLTTAISYPNGRPHIGHAYEAIAADAIARYHRMAGRDVFFQTGTDEHGLKMDQTARAKGMEPRALADEMSSYFKEMDDRLDISYDRFIRTSEPAHHRASQAIWRAMEANGDLYLGRYEGWYSVRDEAFYDEKELTGGEGGTRLSPQGAPVEWTVEESWFFRLSQYQQPLLDLYAARPDFIRPDSRRNEILRFVEGGLSDLSVSRTSFDWGVKVPGSEGHVMYVWVDALTNYITGCGYPDDPERMARYWAEGGDIVHIIGKDIVRFHAVYWPAFLMSAKLPLPRQVFGHGFLLNRGEKMSKSVGNVADPLELADRFGVDQLRYFLLREVSFGQDGSYSPNAIVTRTNADLANSFGNLVQRTLSLIVKNLEGKLPFPVPERDMNSLDVELLGRLELNLGQYQIEFGLLWLDRAIQNWMLSVHDANSYIDEQAPWKLRKTNPERMSEVLATLYLVIYHLAIALQPIAPRGASLILDGLGIANDPQARRIPLNPEGNWNVWDASWYDALVRKSFIIQSPTPAFPRLELSDESF